MQNDNRSAVIVLTKKCVRKQIRIHEMIKTIVAKCTRVVLYGIRLENS